MTGSAEPALEQSLPEGEEEAIRRVAEIVERRLRCDYASIRPAMRGQHAKTYGVVKAEFTVRADAPSHLQHGFFARPGTYEAWVRFSASTSPPGPDRRRDAQGMAIKVMGVAGEKILPTEKHETTQDFVLVNYPAFFCRDAIEYAAFATEVVDAPARRPDRVWGKVRTVLWYFQPPSRWQGRGFRNLVGVAARPVADPLGMRYWSQTPYALGPYAVKYSAAPRPRTSAAGDAAGSAREAMAQRLADEDVTFDFMVQRQADERTMPVDDATVRWDERLSPFLRVATLDIPVQEFTGPDRTALDAALRFTPWHSLAEHRPLGSINRARRDAYLLGSRLRQEMNGVVAPEPESWRGAAGEAVGVRGGTGAG